MRTGEGFLIVFAVDEPTSFEKAEHFREQIRHIKDDEEVGACHVGCSQ